MKISMPIRLRQICLVASDIDMIVDRLCTIFDVAVCHRDSLNVTQWGVRNALMPFGTSFVEVVAPTRKDTSAERYLKRRHGDGGYMAIFTTGDLELWRAHAARQNIRIAATYKHPNYEGIQLHPRDTGGTLFDINRTQGGEGVHGAYGPAGPHWQDHVRTQRVQGIAGATMQSEDPELLAQRWSCLLGRPAVPGDEGWLIRIPDSTLHFVEATDGRGEGLSGIDIKAIDPDAVRATASRLDCLTDNGEVNIGGVRFRLVH